MSGLTVSTGLNRLTGLIGLFDSALDRDFPGLPCLACLNDFTGLTCFAVFFSGFACFSGFTGFVPLPGSAMKV